MGTLDHGKGGWVHEGWEPFIFIQELTRSDRSFCVMDI